MLYEKKLFNKKLIINIYIYTYNFFLLCLNLKISFHFHVIILSGNFQIFLKKGKQLFKNARNPSCYEVKI
jgi:hypothetical protein